MTEGLALNFRRILVVSAHPDDETIACGGLIAKARQAGAEVFVAAFVTGTVPQYGSRSDLSTREAEFGLAMQSLDVNDYDIVLSDDKHLLMDTLPQKTIVDVLERGSRLSLDAVRPDAVIVPGPTYNQDHKALHEACVTALRSYPSNIRHSPATVLSYSHFDEQAWNSQGVFALGRLYVDITPVIADKRKALECYGSQMKTGTLHWRTVENIIHTNRTTGMRIGVGYAEEYACLRMQI